MFFAHSGDSADTSDWQTLLDHSQNVAALAGDFAARFGLERAAFLAGLLHDLGKYDPAFQEKLHGKDARVDHSTAGGQILLQRAEPADQDMAMLIAHAILGHHAGLPDTQTSSEACLAQRIKRKLKLDPVCEKEIPFDARGMTPPVLQSVRPAERSFALSFMGRMLFSCLVDADFKDTEAYYASLGRRQPDRTWPDLADLIEGFCAGFDRKIERLAAAGNEIDGRRSAILSHVRQRAELPPGTFTLTVPTGGGKTLASLGFALDHARRHGMQRIIYAIPFTSIIDQTVAIFREVLGEEHVLAHHASLDEEEGRLKDAAIREQKDKLKLAMEDWAAPVIVTTNVQFFESLYSARPSKARKLHNIANSVIILDEAQTIPRDYLIPCMRALEELTRRYGCTVVLCTATQPALGRREEFEFGLDLEGRELAPDPVALARQFARTRIVHGGEMDNAALVSALGGHEQALVIVNSRRHALELYQAAKREGLDGLIHLTTRQYAADRKRILDDVRERLSENRPCRLVATSLVEAGVDLDFPVAWRAEAGLDQIIQAAGRVNRNAKRDIGASLVTIFAAPDYPPPAEVKALAENMRAVMARYPDLTSPEAIETYFLEVYWKAGKKNLDNKCILEKFSASLRGVSFNYREAGEAFRLIDNNQVPVIVPIEPEAVKIVDELGIKEIPTVKLARQLQSYVVQIPKNARDALERNGRASFVATQLRGDQFFVLSDRTLYSRETGLNWQDPDHLLIEDTII